MADNDAIASTPEFRAKMIAVLLYTDWLVRYGPIIKSEFFSTDAEKVVVDWINWYFDEYGNAPSESDLFEGLMDDAEPEPALDLIETVMGLAEEDSRYASDQAMEFVQVQAMKVAILESVDSIQAGDLVKPLELVRQAQRVGQDRLELGLDLVDDAEDWVYEEMHGRRYPTGLMRVDEILGGGLIAGEYGLVMAPPGRGKSTVLINIGYGMAGLIGATNVLHITYEMPAQKVLKRYGVRVAGIRLHRGTGGERHYIKTLRQQAKQRLKGRLRVIRPSDVTVDGIRRLIDSLAAEDWPTEALIVDYPDLMRPARRRQELRFELADIARDLREIGNEYGIPVWGGTQAGRQTIYNEVIGIQDIAEAIEKAAIADIVISVCQTRDEERLGQGRLYMAKIRDAEDKIMVPVTLDFANQAVTMRRGLDAVID